MALRDAVARGVVPGPRLGHDDGHGDDKSRQRATDRRKGGDADEGETGLTATRVQADCWGASYAAVKAVARTVKSRLSGVKVTVGGVEFQAIFADSEQDLFERGQGGEELYRTAVDFMVWHS